MIDIDARYQRNKAAGFCPSLARSREGRGNREYGYPAAELRGIIGSIVLFPKYNRHIIVLGGWLSIYILNDFHFQDRIF
jgi:hypothetical protein